jgi:hypothetical protein
MKLILLFLIITIITAKKFKKHRHVPDASDLMNHYGGPTNGVTAGPKTRAEQYVEGNPEVFVPQRYDGVQLMHKSLEFKGYPGMENSLNPHPVKSGDFNNVAPNASHIIHPEIAVPKLNLQTEINYPAHVKMPTFYGFRKEFHPVSAYDKLEGRIIHDEAIINKPQYGFEDKVTNISRPVDKYINLNNGEFIDTNHKKTLHGIDSE